jgi:hypothetical protein
MTPNLGAAGIRRHSFGRPLISRAFFSAGACWKAPRGRIGGLTAIVISAPQTCGIFY